VADDPDGRAGREPDGPPVFGSWRRLHFAVLFVLGALILLFYLITKAFE